MKFYLIFIFCIATFIAQAQVKIYNEFNSFEEYHLLNLNSDTTYVINFWATWCVPCVKELPYFEELNYKNKDKPLKVLLVSLDMKNRLEKSLFPFLERNKIISEVVVLADSRANQWIDKIDPRWSGAIPITIIISNNKKYFFEKSYESYNDLNNEILQIQLIN